MSALPPCVIRKITHDEVPHLQIQLKLPAAATRTLLRPASELLETTLGRLGKSNKKKGKNAAAAASAPPVLCDANDVAIAPETPALQAWERAATLQVGGEKLAVLFEPAEVLALQLAGDPLVGIPQSPVCSTRNCEPQNCGFVWEKRTTTPNDGEGEEEAWVAVGDEREYRPSAADVGAALRVRAEPPSMAGLGLGSVAAAAAPVAMPPPRRLLLPRVQALDGAVDIATDEAVAAAAGGSGGGGEANRGFRVLSYNLMADTYSRHWDGPGSVHSYCEPRLTRAASRMPRLLEEVLAYRPDLVCLQECDKSWFETMWAPVLSGRGYEGSFQVKQSAGSSEGVATFVRRDAFQVVATRSVALDLQPPPPSLEPLLEVLPLTRQGVGALPTVAQLLLLQSTAPPARRLLLANTHLYFANPAVQVRLMQLEQLLHAAHTWAEEQQQQEEQRSDGGAAAADGAPPDAAPPLPLLLAGDLNSDATDAVLRLLTDGHVSAADPDWLFGALLWSPAVGLEHDARRAAAAAAATPADAPSGDAQATPADEPPAGLRGAQELALRFHRLRRAIATASATTVAPDFTPRFEAEAKPEATAEADGDDGRAAIAAEVEAGRSLLDSEPLARTEIASQLGLPLGEARTPAALAAARARLVELGSQLEAARTALQAQAQAEEGAPAEALAALAAGVALRQPWQLRSAYGLLDGPTQPTHVTAGYINALDWIAFDDAQLELRAVAPLPPLAELTRDGAIPSAEFPSDHVSLCCDLSWRVE